MADYWACARRESVWGFLRYLRNLLIGLLVGLGGASLILPGAGHGARTLSGALAALAAVVRDLWPLFLGLVAFYIPLVAYSAWRLGRLPRGAREQQYEANAEVLTVRNGQNLRSTIPWSAMRRIRVNERLLMFKLGDTSAHLWRIVPWRAFSAQDQEKLRSFSTRPGVGETAPVTAPPPPS